MNEDNVLNLHKVAWNQYKRLEELISLHDKPLRDWRERFSAEEEVFERMLDVSNKTKNLSGKVINIEGDHYLVMKVFQDRAVLQFIPYMDSTFSEDENSLKRRGRLYEMSRHNLDAHLYGEEGMLAKLVSKFLLPDLK
jgi:hypothetical protein